LPALNTPIFTIAPKSSGLTELEYLSYFYYAGMIFTGLKEYHKALAAFSETLTVPTPKNLSIVQVESFKKMILVSLIADGKVCSFEGTPSHHLQKLKVLGRNYWKLGEQIKHGAEALDKVVNDGAAHYQADNNLGLVKQVCKAFRRREVRKLTDTYVTLSLTDMARRSGTPNAAAAETMLLGMIQDEEIFARVDSKRGMVTFSESPEQYNSREMVEAMDARIREIIDLSAVLQQIHQEAVVSKRYVERTLPKTTEEEAKSDPALAAALARSRLDN
jgi:COP9 signalosome complex subunit 3